MSETIHTQEEQIVTTQTSAEIRNHRLSVPSLEEMLAYHDIPSEVQRRSLGLGAMQSEIHTQRILGIEQFWPLSE